MQFYQDIPRIYTAIAEWGACFTFIFMIKKEQLKNIKFWIESLCILVGLSLFLVTTGDLSEVFWLPCMVVAIAAMYGYIMICGGTSWKETLYCCARAFLLAEFVASLQWQIVSFCQVIGYDCLWLQITISIIIYMSCFAINISLEKTFFAQNYLSQINGKEIMAAAVTAIAAFTFSNLSFLYMNLPFTSNSRADIFTIRTLVDFGGMAILHAYQSRICEYVAEHEVMAMDAVLKSQYDQYRNYQDSLDLIHLKYHDLKHQITGLRMETDEEKRNDWIEAMEEELSAFETLNKTGNQVLDTILAAKIFHCRKNHIQITCVADGELIDFMHVTDICSLFGNAMDNAIEHVIMIPEVEKRLIHVTVSSKKSFIFIKIENYCDTEVQKNEENLISTTKVDKKNHGFGLKSIQNVVEKYDGSIDFAVNQNWFQLKILLPKG